MRILFIHGRAQEGKDPVALKQVWVDTLKKGFQACGETLPDDVKIDFPFYGDKLDELTTKAKLDDPDGLTKKGGGEDKQYQEFMRSALGEIKERRNIPDEEIEKEFEGTDIKERGIQNWGWVRAIARYLDKNHADVSEFTIEKYLTDVYLYVNSPLVTKTINQIVEDKLTEEPTIVVSHSLGTVVGYKVILDNISKLNVHKHITVGSPLGITAITTKLNAIMNPGQYGDWYNAYDEADIVALNPLKKPYFTTDPEIINFKGVKNHTDNHHGIIGYLDDKYVASEINAALAEEPTDT